MTKKNKEEIFKTLEQIIDLEVENRIYDAKFRLDPYGGMLVLVMENKNPIFDYYEWNFSDLLPKNKEERNQMIDFIKEKIEECR